MIHHCEFAITESQIQKMVRLQITSNPLIFLYNLLETSSTESVVSYVKSATSSHGYYDEEAGNMIING